MRYFITKTKSKLCFVSLFLFLVFLHSTSLSAQAIQNPYNPYDLQVAYVYKFLQFIKSNYPQSEASTSNFDVCVSNRNGDLLSAFNKIENLPVHQRTIRILPISKLDEIRNCNLMYVSDDFSGDFDNLVTTLSQHQVLSISEIQNFADAGGIVQFIHKDNKLRFIINLSAAKKLGIEISSKLLSLAENIL